MIYLDNAATSMTKPSTVIDSVVYALTHSGNVGRGANKVAQATGSKVYQTRKIISELFGVCDPAHVVFTANSTEALNISVVSFLNSGDQVVTTVMEHNSVLRPLYRAREELDVGLTIIGTDSQGKLDTEALYAALAKRPRALYITHASNLTGNVNDVRAIGEVAARFGVTMIVDASQSAGLIDIDMTRDHIGMLCFTGHKSLYGPQGTGGLCVSPDIQLRPFKVGGTGVDSFNQHQPAAMPTLLEAGTLNSHGIAGLFAGVEFIRAAGVPKMYEQAMEPARAFYSLVKEIPGVTVYGDWKQADIRTPIVPLNITDVDSGDISSILNLEYEIATRPGAHCAPLMHKALGTEAQGIVRFSFGHFNTMADAHKAAAAVEEIASSMRE